MYVSFCSFSLSTMLDHNGIRYRNTDICTLCVLSAHIKKWVPIFDLFAWDCGFNEIQLDAASNNFGFWIFTYRSHSPWVFRQSIIGVLFSTQKSYRKKLTKNRISPENAQIILSKIELLTVLPINEINLGIDYIKTLTTEQPELSAFWNYFTRTWLQRFNPALWNLSNLGDVNMAGRTNNSLERYNRRLGEHFSNAHPNLCAFVSVIKNEFQYYSEKCSEIRQNASGLIN